MKILVAEDEPKVLNFIQKGLAQSEMNVDAVSDLDELFSNLLSVQYDVIVLDRMLKGRDALIRICDIRKKAPQSKILILSALSEVDDRVEGLDCGADDYLSKPFHVAELVARIRALMRRQEQNLSEKNILFFEDLVVKLESQRVERAGQRLELTPKEYKVLVSLLQKPNRIFSKVELINNVWEIQYYPESNVVEVIMTHLRNKVNKGFDRPIIHSKRGKGYWLGDPDL